MLSLLTQTAITYTYNYGPTMTTRSTHLPSWFWNAFFVGLVLGLISLIGMAKTFAKAGRPWWAVIIPFYNTWLLAEIGGKPGWWGLAPLLGVIPFVGNACAIVVSILVGIGIGKNFGKSSAFGAIAVGIFAFVGFCILGFGDSQYQKPSESSEVPGASGPPPAAPTAV